MSPFTAFALQVLSRALEHLLQAFLEILLLQEHQANVFSVELLSFLHLPEKFNKQFTAQ